MFSPSLPLEERLSRARAELRKGGRYVRRSHRAAIAKNHHVEEAIFCRYNAIFRISRRSSKKIMQYRAQKMFREQPNKKHFTPHQFAAAAAARHALQNATFSAAENTRAVCKLLRNDLGHAQIDNVNMHQNEDEEDERFEDDVSLTDDSDVEHAGKKSNCETTLLNGACDNENERTHEEELVAEQYNSSTLCCDPRFINAVKSLRGTETLPRSIIESIAGAVSGYAELFRRTGPHVSVRDAFEINEASGCQSHLATSLPKPNILGSTEEPLPECARLSRDVLRVALHRASVLKWMHQGGINAARHEGENDQAAQFPQGIKGDVRKLLKRVYGDCNGVAEDDEMLAEIAPFVEKDCMRNITECVRKRQLEILMNCMKCPHENIANRLVTAFKSCRRVMACTEEDFERELNVERKEAAQIWKLVFGKRTPYHAANTSDL